MKDIYSRDKIDSPKPKEKFKKVQVRNIWNLHTYAFYLFIYCFLSISLDYNTHIPFFDRVWPVDLLS